MPDAPFTDQPLKASSDPLDASLAAFSGIGPKRGEVLARRGLQTFRDALFHIPVRYQDLRRRDRIRDLLPGTTALVAGRLLDFKTRPMRQMRGRRIATATLADADDARLRVAWFNLYGDGRLPLGETVALLGRVTTDTSGRLEMLHPELFRASAIAALSVRPIYRLPPEIPQNLFAAIVREALKRARGADLDAIPAEVRAQLEQPGVLDALAYLHQPPPDADPAALTAGRTPYHQTLALDELFAFQLAMALDRQRLRRRAGAILTGGDDLRAKLLAALPFTPTQAQQRAIREIDSDLATPSPMNRILVGDVGSGKTLVAFAAILRAVGSGWQAVVMAPTELLAEQLFRNFTQLCGPLGITSVLITGSLTPGERGRILRALARGQIPVAFGTHALIQQGVRVDRLGLAVIDEQHRFGVFDRVRLLDLGAQANVLLMSATPIPRSLALTLFRNVDVSVLDETPAGRTPVTTTVVDDAELPRVDSLLRAELTNGHRAYYVLPLIESDEDDTPTVKAAADRLSRVLGDFRIGVLHGRMRAGEKERVMRDFRDGRLDLLVATTVIEVGVDVPEATMMVIIAAERYGLSQLHQLRGRVGRGPAPSHCLMVVSHDASTAARTRLQELAETARGDAVAELDLRTRGPGDLLGARQTGALPLRFAALIDDLALVERSGALAEAWLRQDPTLSTPASGTARRAIRRLQSFGFSLGNIG